MRDCEARVARVTDYEGAAGPPGAAGEAILANGKREAFAPSRSPSQNECPVVG